MEPRIKASILWGVIGILVFLILVQGYELLANDRVTISVKVAVAVLVGGVAIGVTYVADRRIESLFDRR